MIVMRPFSYRWDMVSEPDPVASMYAALLGERTAKVVEGRPFGERLICLVSVCRKAKIREG
jgi:hypothetical protein